MWEAVTQSLCDGFIDHGMAHRPLVLEDLIFVLFGILMLERGLKPRKGGLAWNFAFNFLQNFQAILGHELCRPLRQVIHLLGADPEKVCQVSLLTPFIHGSLPVKNVTPAASFATKKSSRERLVRRESLKFQGAFICSELTVSPELVLLRFRAARRMTRVVRPKRSHPKFPRNRGT